MDILHSIPCRTLFAAVASALVASACGGSGSDGPPPVPPSIRVSSSAIDAAAGGESVSVDVSNGGSGTLNWTASIASGTSWARVSSGASGTNSGTVQIAVDRNTGAAREVVLTVSASGATSRTVTVRQAEAPAMLELSAADTELEGEGGSITLEVRNAGHTEMRWTAALPDDAEWARIESGESGTDDGQVVVRYDLNGGEDRELEVTVTAPQASNSPKSVTLSQDWFATECTYSEARGEVLDIMKGIYYFNDEADQESKYAGLDVDSYKTLNALLDELRWMPNKRDRGFTYWLTAAESERIFSAEAYILGLRFTVILNLSQDPRYLQVVDVYQGSPAGDAGINRGDKVMSVNGQRIDEMVQDEIYTALGPNENGYKIAFEIETLSGESKTVELAKRLVSIPTVPEEHVEIFDTGAGKVGYLHFRTFFGDANDRLLEEFAGFKSAGVRHLIVDLRYNGGGSVPIAHGLATLIGGPELFGTVMSRRVHNALFASFGYNITTRFDCGVYGAAERIAKCRNESSLGDLEKVVFITSDSSASASELVITALQPHEEVTLVGWPTYGKPVGQYGFNFCPRVGGGGSVGGGPEAILWPVSFATENSEGFGDYYDGIDVKCAVTDDFASELGTADEDRIAVALRYIETGSCTAPASAGTAAERGVMQQLAPQDPVAQFLGH